MNNRKGVLNAFIPTLAEMLVLSAVSAAALFFLNVVHILKSFGTTGSTVLTDYLHIHVQRLAHLLDIHVGTQGLSVFFWMMVGSIVYLLVWVAAVVIHSYSNDIPVMHGFIKPNGYAKRNGWHNAGAKMLIRLLALMAFVYWFYLLFVRILPFTSKLFLDSFSSLSLMSVGRLAASIVGTALALFAFTVFLRLMFLRIRVFH